MFQFIFLMSIFAAVIAQIPEAGPYSVAVNGRRPDRLASYPSESSVGLALDWAFCQQKCLLDAVCVMFGWSANQRSCFLYSPGSTFSGATTFDGTNGDYSAPGSDLHHVLGRIDRMTGGVVWLSLGRPAMTASMPIAGADVYGMYDMCKLVCDSNSGAVPCLGVSMKTELVSFNCLFYMGYFDDTNQLDEDVIYSNLVHKLTTPEPTGNGTLILNANLPQEPPIINPIPFTLTIITAIPLGEVGDVGLAKLAAYNDGSYATYTDCAIKCHMYVGCRSFIWNAIMENCLLFDIAVRGTIMLGEGIYGVIDDTGMIEYMMPAQQNLIPVVLASYESVMTIEECAQKCYEFYQPIYCNSFQLVETASRCLLYSIELDGWTPDSVAVPFQSDCKFGLIEGRRSYNHYNDAGIPRNQLVAIPTVLEDTTTTTTQALTTTTASSATTTKEPTTSTTTSTTTATSATAPITTDTYILDATTTTASATAPTRITTTDTSVAPTDAPNEMPTSTPNAPANTVEEAEKTINLVTPKKFIGVHYRIFMGRCRADVSAVEEVTAGTEPTHLNADCAQQCAPMRSWCHGFVADITSNSCKLYDVELIDPDGEFISDPNCVYGHGTPIWQ